MKRSILTLILISLFFISVGGLAATASLAAGGEPADSGIRDSTLADEAEVILVGRVLDITPTLGTEGAETDVRVEVEEVIQGQLLHSPTVVRVPSGALETEAPFRIDGRELFSRGQRALIFLTADGRDATYRLLRGAVGAFHITELDGRSVAYRNFWARHVPYGPDLEAGHHQPLRDLERFRHWLGTRAYRLQDTANYWLDADTTALIQPSPRPWAPSVAQASVVAQTPVAAFSPGDPASKMVRAQGFVTDPAGDATDNAFTAVSPDLVSAAIRSDGVNLSFEAFYAPGTFDERFDTALFELDMDENANTGLGALVGTVSALRGWEFLIVFGANEAEVREFDPTRPPGGSRVNVVAEVPAIDRPDGYEATIPLAIFHDDEHFRFKLTTDVRIGSGFTSPTDFMSDPNEPPGLMRPLAIAPSAPTDLQAVASAGRVDLTWTDTSNNEQEFRVERRVGNGSFQRIGTTAANATGFSDSGVVSGTLYTYRVQAVNGIGVSAWSPEATVTTLGEPAPSALVATAISTSEIRLAWTDNASGEGGYRVQMRAGGTGGFASVLNLPANTTEAVVGSLEPATSYTFRVQSTGGTGASSFSNEASAITFAANPEPCVEGPITLCLNRGRFKVEVEWQDFTGNFGPAFDAGLISPDSGLLYYFEPNNWEMLLKVLDACDFNGHFWVFAAATTNVGYTLTVTDSLTGLVKTYNNPLGVSSPAITDTSAFATCAAEEPDPVAPPPSPGFLPGSALDGGRFAKLAGGEKEGNCTPSETTLCLNDGRFQVEVDWAANSETGVGRVDSLESPDSGLFYFFEPSNLELMVKVLDGCAFNDRVWVFSAATTDVEYTLRVVDTETGEEKQYFNVAGNAADAVTDVDAFASCP